MAGTHEPIAPPVTAAAVDPRYRWERPLQAPGHKPASCFDPPHMGSEYQAESKEAPARRIVRIDFDRSVEDRDGVLVVRPCQAPEVRLRLGNQFPGSKNMRRARERAHPFCR